jgi:hypothetical protein
MKPRGPTTAQLRDAIDRGRTGSKVPHPDPAAAPLGTDEEAAGTPPAPDAVRTALRNEVLSRGRHSPRETRPRETTRKTR